MRVKSLFIAVVVLISSKGHCYKNGYSKETCDDMIPNHEQGERNVTLSNHLRCPYNIELPDRKYRRNRELEVFIDDSDIMGFQLQFRKTESSKIERVGEFVSIPDGTKFLQCDDGKNTAVTNKDLEPKNELKFKWLAPKEDEGTIALKTSFVSGDKYWTTCSEAILECAEFPVSVDDCGVNKSCVRFSSGGGSCDGNTCSYLLTYYKSDERTVTFSLSGLSMEQNCYIAVAYKKEESGGLSFTVCIKNDEGVDVKHYILDKRKGFFERTEDLQNIITDIDGNKFWCEFSTAVAGAGPSLDLDTEIDWVYTWGKMDTTLNQPIVNNSTSTWFEATHNVSELINLSLSTGGSKSISLTGFIPIFLSSLSLFIFQM